MLHAALKAAARLTRASTRQSSWRRRTTARCSASASPRTSAARRCDGARRATRRRRDGGRRRRGDAGGAAVRVDDAAAAELRPRRRLRRWLRRTTLICAPASTEAGGRSARSSCSTGCGWRRTRRRLLRSTPTTRRVGVAAIVGPVLSATDGGSPSCGRERRSRQDGTPRATSLRLLLPLERAPPPQDSASAWRTALCSGRRGRRSPPPPRPGSTKPCDLALQRAGGALGGRRCQRRST